MLEGLRPLNNTRTRQDLCKVSTTLLELSETDFAILTEAINDHIGWPAFGLERALSERGVILSDDTIRKHRKKICCCFREASC